MLFDSREGGFRPSVIPANSPAKENLPQIPALGVMNYVELDATNLSNWLRSPAGGAANLNNNTGGFTVYFSDRRGELPDTQNGGGLKTGSCRADNDSL